MPDKKTKNEATASDGQDVGDWLSQAQTTLNSIQQLSESVYTKRHAFENEQINQMMMRRGEEIQTLVAILTPDRMKILTPELRQSFSEVISQIKAVDVEVNEQLLKTMDTIQSRLVGLKQGKRSLRGYHLSGGNQDSHTRSNNV